jgi:hypothetical protein
VMSIFKLPKQSDVNQFYFGNLDIKIVENTPENREHIMDAVRQIYESEPCRICGELIGDASKAVFAGYSHDSKSRCAHKTCWNSNTPKEKWAYPTDSK